MTYLYITSKKSKFDIDLKVGGFRIRFACHKPELQTTQTYSDTLSELTHFDIFFNENSDTIFADNGRKIRLKGVASVNNFHTTHPYVVWKRFVALIFVFFYGVSKSFLYCIVHVSLTAQCGRQKISWYLQPGFIQTKVYLTHLVYNSSY